MARYDVTPTVERDFDDRIVRIGVQWGETRPGFDQIMVVLAMTSLAASVLGFFWALAVEHMNPMFGFGVVGFIGSVCLLFAMPPNPRAVYFHADGRTQVPYGILHHPGIDWLGGSHAYIVSIEARLDPDHRPSEGDIHRRPFQVLMLSSGGDLVIVSGNLHEWVALKVAARLTHSLTELRREQADDMSGGFDAWVRAE